MNILNKSSLGFHTWGDCFASMEEACLTVHFTKQYAEYLKSSPPVVLSKVILLLWFHLFYVLGVELLCCLNLMYVSIFLFKFG